MVINAVDPFRIANILELAPNDAYENKTNGSALFVTAKIIIPRNCGLKCFLYFFCRRKGVKIRPASKSLDVTKNEGPISGVATLINIKALPQMAARKINILHSLGCIIKRYK